MSAARREDYEREYVGPAFLRAYRQAVGVWARDAAAYRQACGRRALLDVAYGDRPRQRLDLFEPAHATGGPVAAFIHGGYWQVMDKAHFSHLARGANGRGVTVAVVDHTLCPQVSLAELVGEIRQAVAFLSKRFRRPVTVYGHSSGGHLAACTLATRWDEVDPALGDGAAASALCLSGLFELEPLLSTSVNDTLRLDVEAARRLSPSSMPAPTGRPLVACVGETESHELRRQTRDFAARWSAAGASAKAFEIEGAGHFSIVAPLADPDSALTGQLLELTGSSD